MEEGADRPLRSRTDPERVLTLLSMILNQNNAVTARAGAVPSLYALSSTHLSVICIFWWLWINTKIQFSIFLTNSVNFHGSEITLTQAFTYLICSLASSFYTISRSARHLLPPAFSPSRFLRELSCGLLTRTYTAAIYPTLTFSHPIFNTPPKTAIPSLEQTRRWATQLL